VVRTREHGRALTVNRMVAAMLVDDLFALLFDIVLWLGQLIVEAVVALLTMAATICMWTGRALFRLLGRNP